MCRFGSGLVFRSSFPDKILRGFGGSAPIQSQPDPQGSGFFVPAFIELYSFGRILFLVYSSGLGSFGGLSPQFGFYHNLLAKKYFREYSRSGRLLTGGSFFCVPVPGGVKSVSGRLQCLPFSGARFRPSSPPCGRLRGAWETLMSPVYTKNYKLKCAK